MMDNCPPRCPFLISSHIVRMGQWQRCDNAVEFWSGSFKVHGTFPPGKDRGVNFPQRGAGIVRGLICHTLNSKGHIKMPSCLLRRLTGRERDVG